MDLPDPDIQAGSWDGMRAGIQRNLDALAKAASSFGGKSVEIRFGGNSGAWPGGSPRANDTTISHGLGRTPTVVVATVTSSPSGTWFPVVATLSYTSTGFNLTAVTSDGSSPAAAAGYSVAWIAIG